VATNLPGSGAKVDVAIEAGMPCFQAGGGAAGAAVCACTEAPMAKANPMPLSTRM